MTISRRSVVVGGGSAAALNGLPWKASAADQVAELIIFGGPILTMDDAQPSAGAVAVKDGRIVALGTESELKSKWAGAGTRLIDLAGRTLLPGFIDGHGHFMNAPRVVNWANVSPAPAGPVSTIPDILKALQENVAQRKIPKGEWVVGYGYDATALAEGRELTRRDLDSVLSDHPVMCIHVSNHGGVLNSMALKAFDITAATVTPPAGVILREPGTNEPAGLLMETAFMPVFAKMPQPSEAELLDLLKPAQELYASKGMTTVQEGATHVDELAFLRKAAAQGRFYVDVVSLPFVAEVPKIFAEYLSTGSDGKPVVVGDPSLEFGSYKGRLKLGGMKFVTDGSPQGKTAFWTKPLLTDGPAGEKNYVGAPTFPKAVIADLYKKVTDRGIQIWSHANGDAAIDIVIDSAEAAGLKAGDERRHVVIHSQCMRPEQLDSYVKLGLSPSFFTAHTFFWGDVHLTNLGPERAAFMSPMKSADAKGIRFSNHNDFMVTPIDPMRMVWSAVQRRSRTGAVLGPDERVDVTTALKALTIHPAWHYREEASKGSITPGKLADLVILDKNPLAVPVDDILGIKVVETFKEGRSIYAAGQKAGENGYRLSPRRTLAAGARAFSADDGTMALPGCTCCVDGLRGDVREAALRSMTEFADSPLFA